MAENSKIQWTDHTINFWTGCHKVSTGCKFCYMYRDQERYGKKPTDVLKVKQKTIEKVLRKAVKGDKIFTCSWSDFFIEEADEWRSWAWDIIRSRPDLDWQILTKRPERIAECLPEDWGQGWNNVWLGISVENQENALKRIPILADIPCKVRFLSIEPLVGRVELNKIFTDGWFPSYNDPDNSSGAIPAEPYLPYFHWVIVGGESGNENGKWKYRPSKSDWYNEIVDVCSKFNVPVFVKQLGTHLSKEFALSDRHGGDINEFPKNLQVRQFPKSHNIKEFVLGNAKDLARNFLYYDRKEDEDLKIGDIQESVSRGLVTKEEIIQAFSDELDKWWN